jgi:hypothetical protein
MPSAAKLNRLGMYSIVRNPLYLGNAIMWLGVALATASGWFVAVTVLAYWLYIERVICAEEAFLAEQFGDDYQAWVTTTPCFVPRLAHWQASDMAFSLRTVLRREYLGFIALAVAFTLVDFVPDVVLGGEPISSWLVTDRGWVVFLAVAVVLGLAVRLVKKLHLLDTAGR